MNSQTIALFRYQMLALINRKNLIVLCAIYLSSFLLSQFSSELAIINSTQIALGLLADFLRYSLVLFLMIITCNQIAQDYDSGQFDRLLAMPISRWQYVIAQVLVVIVTAFGMCLPMFLLIELTSDLNSAAYWSFAVFIELILVGLISMLSILSLEKLPAAMLLSIAFYLFSKFAPLINYIFDQSALFYSDEKGFQLGHTLISLMLYVLPDLSIFAQNDALFTQHDLLGLLFKQIVSLSIYGGFVLMIILFDFYRKEMRG